jgi:lysozyme
MNMTYSKDGLALTESFEGCRLTAYRDSVGVLTIGYGHTGPDVQEGMTITQARAEELLLADVAKATAAVNAHVKVTITQDEFDALVDFAFNAGCAAFEGSTMLRDINAGNFMAAAEQFERWDHAGGKVLAGLLRRRISEEKLFDEVAA